MTNGDSQVLVSVQNVFHFARTFEPASTFYHYTTKPSLTNNNMG